jgi:hypothetical protein
MCIVVVDIIFIRIPESLAAIWSKSGSESPVKLVLSMVMADCG